MSDIQQRINEIQNLYKEWTILNQQLQHSHQLWQRGCEIVKQLEAFYQQEYQNYYEQIEQGLEVDLTTDGEHSIMSEDAIWNALHDHEKLLWKQLKLAVQHLDHCGDE